MITSSIDLDGLLSLESCYMCPNSDTLLVSEAKLPFRIVPAAVNIVSVGEAKWMIGSSSDHDNLFSQQGLHKSRFIFIFGSS
jgi:hypothetical protein